MEMERAGWNFSKTGNFEAIDTKTYMSVAEKSAAGEALAAYFAYKWSKFNQLTISYWFDQEEVYLQFFSTVFGYEGLLSHVHFSYCNRKG